MCQESTVKYREKSSTVETVGVFSSGQDLAYDHYIYLFFSFFG